MSLFIESNGRDRDAKLNNIRAGIEVQTISKVFDCVKLIKTNKSSQATNTTIPIITNNKWILNK